MKENVSKIKTTKKKLDIENMFKYDKWNFMHKFKRDILQINFEPYFYILIKYIITYQVFHKQAIFPRVSSPYGHKSLSYLGCKLWEELPRNLKDLSYLGAFQFWLRNNLLKRQSEKNQA